MKLIVDIELNAELLTAQPDQQVGLSYLLSHSSHGMHDAPLEAFFCESEEIIKNPDYPLAAIAANVDGLNVESFYWLRSAPVYLVMQRDTFSMGDQVPLPVSSDEAQALLETLNNHFAEDGLLFEVGLSGDWYLKVPFDYHALPVETILPSCVIQKNISQFMPKGDSAQFWISLQNEIQMLLFQHPINESRELNGKLPVNSLWFSGGGEMPETDIRLVPENMTIVANTPFYEGVAHFTNKNFAKLDLEGASPAFEQLIRHANQDVRLQLLVDDLGDWFDSFVSLLKTKVVKELTINIGWYEKTMVAKVKPIDLKKFWRKSHPLTHFLK